MNDLKPLHKTIIACVFLVTLAFLQWKGLETAAFITVGLLLLGIAGYSLGKVEAVQKQTNGGQQMLIDVIKESNQQQAALIRLVASLPPAPTEIKEEKPILEGNYRDDHSREESMASSR